MNKIVIVNTISQPRLWKKMDTKRQKTKKRMDTLVTSSHITRNDEKWYDR